MEGIIRCGDVNLFLRNFYLFSAGYRKSHDGLDGANREGEEGIGEPILIENEENKYLKGIYYLSFYHF